MRPGREGKEAEENEKSWVRRGRRHEKRKRVCSTYRLKYGSVCQ